MKTYNLTEKEMNVVKAIVEANEKNGCQMEYFEPEFATVQESEDGMIDASYVDKRDIEWENRRSLGGILSNLEKKGVIIVEHYEEYDGTKVNNIWADPEALKIIAGIEEEPEEQIEEAEEEQAEEVQEEQEEQNDEINDMIEKMFNRMKEKFNAYLEGEGSWNEADEKQLKETTRRHWAVNGKNGEELTEEDIEEVRQMVMMNKALGIF